MNVAVKAVLIIPVVVLIGCKPNTAGTPTEALKKDTLKQTGVIVPNQQTTATPSADAFEKAIYLKIDKVHSGNIYTNSNGFDCFYRVLQIPEEENIMLVAEHITIGEEGGNYKLLKRIHLTGPNTPLANYFFNSGDSLSFVDSTSVAVHVGDKVVAINLDKLK
ncbi:hypothetical protein [Mucilaginibacter psychrotolerans]|uniref:Lipoprotein n=1 Tax=Mucilaginibacter psychrotolerans TaxID=1524096 RepID=A0A4Y8S6V4_9SPHI|nr:hypothetical protein [Mucilaginibacter psychrotolerans]TFF34335.1 hypothetical protein E2R66_22645 [Mucilaginibacter psychrotolerans]